MSRGAYASLLFFQGWKKSAAMVTRIAARKTSIESSERAIQGGEVAHLRKENERMAALVKSLEDLKVSLQKEN